jgi:manganese-dependent inorganic pyrophosphatase
MNEYDPVGGHTKEEADAAYETLFKELHGDDGNTQAERALTGKNRVYVVGHKTPDTDSVCAALGYAHLKNAVARDAEFVPCRAGHISEETAFVLERFNAKPPEYLADVRARVEDVDMRRLQGVPEDTTLRKAWALLKERNIVTLPVTEKALDGTGEHIRGLVTVKDIGKVYLDNNSPALLSESGASYQNVREVLDAEIAVDNGQTHFGEGRVIVAAAEAESLADFIEVGDIVIVSNREEAQKIAIGHGAGCIIVTMGAEISPDIRQMAKARGCLVISTPHDTYAVARLINQSIPVGYAMLRDGIITFKTTDYLGDVKKTMSKVRHRDFPVLDDKGHFIGMISRRFLLDAGHKKVILVDHNEQSQAVDGIEEAEILEIIDHHRLGSMETLNPVFFRNQPVGATSTIIFQMYKEHGIKIENPWAGLLCSGIISDTLLFRSPTTTQFDKLAAMELANIAGIDLENYASELFHAGSGDEFSDADPVARIFKDFKTFNVNELQIGIGQINFMDQERLTEMKAMLMPDLEGARAEKQLDLLYVMLTNIPASSSEILCCGETSADLLETAYEIAPKAGVLSLEGVISRKKQLLPELLAALQG